MSASTNFVAFSLIPFLSFGSCSKASSKVEEVKVFEVGKCYSSGDINQLSHADETIYYVYTADEHNAYMVDSNYSSNRKMDTAKYYPQVDCDKERPHLLRDYLFHQLNYKDTSIKEVTEVCMKAEQLKLLRNQNFCDQVKKVYEYHFGV